MTKKPSKGKDKKAPYRQKYVQKVTWAHATRDVIITAMNRGLFFGLVFVGIIFVMLLKMESHHVFELSKSVIGRLENASLWGYILFIGCLVGWFFHVKRIRQFYSSTNRSAK